MLYARSDNDLANMVGCLVVELAAVGCNPNTSKLLWSDLYDLYYLFAGDRRATARTMETFSHAATKKNNSNTSKTKIWHLKIWKYQCFCYWWWNVGIAAWRAKKCRQTSIWWPSEKAIVDMQHRSQIGYMKFNEHIGTLLNRHLSLRLRLKFLILSSLLQFWLVFMMCPLTSN